MATSTLQYLYQHLSTYDHYTLDIVFLIAVISVFPYLLICYFLKSTPSTTRVDTKKNDEGKPIIQQQPEPQPQHTKEEEILSPVITILPPPKIIKKQSIDLESQNKKQIQNTISELLSTEQTYIHQLETLNTMFIQPIQNQKLIKNQKVFDTIFPIDIQIITRTNQQFFHHLKHIIQLYSLSDKSLNSFSSFSRSQTSTPISPTTTTATTTTIIEQQLNHTNHNDNENNSMENDEGDELLKMEEEEEDVEQMSEYAHNTTNSQTESENDSDDNSSTTSSSDDIEEAEPVMNDLDVESTASTTTSTSTSTTISPISPIAATPRETTNTTTTSTSTTSPSLVISSNLHLDIDINQSQLYNIGHLFNHYSKLFRLYVGYISKYQNCVRTLEMECEKNKKLNSFLSAQMNQLMQLNQNTMIYDYLITMIQRIPRYQLLLQDLMRHIELKQPQQPSSDENNEVEEVEDVNQSTRTILSHALESIKHTAKYCNEKEREVHMLLKLFQIEKSLPQKYLMKSSSSSSSNNSGHHSISELSNGGEQNTNRRVLLEVYNQMTPHHHDDDGYDNGGEDAADALLNTTVHYYSLKKKRFRPMGELFLCNDCLLFEKEKKRISNMKKRRKSSKKKSLVAAVVTTMSSQKRKEDYYHIQYWKLRSVTHYGTVVNVQLNLNYQNESNVFQLVTTFEQQSSQQSQHVFMSRRKSAHESTASSTSTTADHNNSSSGGGSSVTHQCVIRCPSTYSYNQITSVISELIK